MREPPDAVDSEEHTSGCRQRERKGTRLMMLTQMQTSYQQGEEQACSE